MYDDQRPRPDVLVVEDEEDIRDLIAYHLRRSHNNPIAVASASEAMQVLYDRTPQLILLDWRLPDIDGLELLRRIRRLDTAALVPVLMLTARTAVADRVRGLDVGADDYLVKPFSPNELRARVNALLRRTGSDADEVLSIGPEVSLRIGTRELQVRKRSQTLGKPEAGILQYLARNPNTVCSRERLLAALGGSAQQVGPRSIDVYVSRLRQALGDKSGQLRTLRGSGYYLQTQNND